MRHFLFTSATFAFVVAAAGAQPAKTAAPGQGGQTVTCRDGSTGAAGRRACSGHGGIAPAKPAAAKTPVATPATVAKPVTPAPGAPAAPSAATGAAPRATAAKPVTPVAPPSAARPAAAAPSKATAAAPAKAAAVDDKDPRGAAAQCKDGTYWHSATRQGACSRHKGVEKWMGA